MAGRHKDFEAVLQKLRGKDVDVSQEAAEIQDYLATLDRLPKATLLDLFQRRYLPSVPVAVFLMAFQELGGINAISFYVSDIFEQAGFSSTIGTIIYAILQVVVTGIGVTNGHLQSGCILKSTRSKAFYFLTYQRYDRKAIDEENGHDGIDQAIDGLLFSYFKL